MMVNTTPSVVIFISIILALSSIAASPLSEDKIETNQPTRGETASDTGTTNTTTSARPSTASQSTSTIPSLDQTNTTDAPEVISSKDTSTFTCQGKINGYYADVRLNCRVYHFCTKIDGIGEASTYQRMSYICLEGSVFDQRDLNCVHEKDLKTPCSKAELEYESSNKQFDAKDESQASMSDSIAAGIMMNPITRFLAGR